MLEPGRVRCEGVAKRYQLGRWGTLRDAVGRWLERSRGGEARHSLHALRDVSFALEPGEALSIIGGNGAGKTTLLRILSRITRPSAGRVEIGGRCSALIELGAGFHPELSGRENIFLNGAILGLRKEEIRRRLDAIVAFSGLERFLDTPVKRYSSGMYVRLGFAVAAHVEPDVLLIDEVLAVGDVTFRHRCLERLESLRERGTTIVFVSHNSAQVRRIAPRALLLVAGEVRFLGPTDEALAAYRSSLDEGSKAAALPGRQGALEPAHSTLLEPPVLLDATGRPVEEIDSAGELRLRVAYHSAWPLPDPYLHAYVLRHDGLVCCRTSWRPSAGGTAELSGDGELEIRFRSLPLAPGRYRIQLAVHDAGDRTVDTAESATWRVRGGVELRPEREGVFIAEAGWKLDPAVPARNADATATARAEVGSG